MALHEQPLARGVSQGEVWDAVRARASRLTSIPHRGERGHVPGARRLAREARGGVPAQPGQCGALLAVGDVLCVDAFSRPDAFARLWPKLRRGYMLDAIILPSGGAMATANSKAAPALKNSPGSAEQSNLQD